jgi:hypothetical protein
VIKNGWYVITGSYFVTLFLASWMYTAITKLPIDQHRDVSGLVLGSVMVVIPYIVGGLYAGIAHKRGATRAAVWIGILPAIAEKVLIFLIGSCYVIMEGSPITWENVMMFVSAEAVPYYTNAYLLTFPLSVLVCVATAACVHVVTRSKG